MGYTRYWNRTDKLLTPEFITKVKEILENCKSLGITIRDGYGEGSPVVTVDKVWLNGDSLFKEGEYKFDLSHETFVLDNENINESNFCKTERKPYDYAVREILKVAKQMGIVTNVRDDGINETIISDKSYARPYIREKQFFANEKVSKVLSLLDRYIIQEAIETHSNDIIIDMKALLNKNKLRGSIYADLTKDDVYKVINILKKSWSYTEYLYLIKHYGNFESWFYDKMQNKKHMFKNVK